RRLLRLARRARRRWTDEDRAAPGTRRRDDLGQGRGPGRSVRRDQGAGRRLLVRGGTVAGRGRGAALEQSHIAVGAVLRAASAGPRAGKRAGAQQRDAGLTAVPAWRRQPLAPAIGHWRAPRHFGHTLRPVPPTGASRMSFTSPLFITFAAYLLLMIGLGFVAWRRTRTFDDYILGGRSLGSFVTALAAGASDMSGWLMMGLPGALCLSGASDAWIA